MSWFRREDKPLSSTPEKHVRTEGLWLKCEGCRNIIWKKDLAANAEVCPRCQRHFRLDARSRLRLLFDDGQFQERDATLSSNDPLQFTDLKPYVTRLAEAQRKTGLKDAVITAEGTLEGRPVIICAMEMAFIGGSMGAVVGEKITRAIERAASRREPIIIISASGGARMMEGAVSLMQMAKIAAALARLDEAGVPFISVLTDPTTGGVTASYAMLGDLNVAEPGALIGFAGPRVIEQTIRQKLPPNFQRSEFLLEHGMLDAIVPRKEMRAFLHRALNFFQPAAAATAVPAAARSADARVRLGKKAAEFVGAHEYLHSLGWELRPGRKFDLAEVAAILAGLGDPQRAFPSVHIAGTNGKGSVAALIAAAAAAAGLRAGLYTSPHLQRVTERIRVAEQEIAADDFSAAVGQVRQVAERLLAAGRLPHPPSFFEAITAAAFVAFAAARVELAVVEVGLGGRLDATNVISPRVAVLTAIGLDHEAYLGPDVASIAAEKAGIIKPGLEAVVSAPQAPEAMAVIRRACERAAVRLEIAEADETTPVTPLAGRHQRDNAAVAALACARLGLPEAAVRAGFAAVRWPGRLERVQSNPEVYLDGAHNPQAARALGDFLATLATLPILVFGTMRDKAVDEICEILFPHARAVVVTAPAQPRAAAPAALAAACGAYARACEFAPRFPQALERALALSAQAGGAPIFITGSLYLVGEARDHWFPSGT